MAGNEMKKTYTIDVNVGTEKYKQQLKQMANEAGVAVKEISENEVVIRLDQNIKGYDQIKTAIQELGKNASIRLAIDKDNLKKQVANAKEEIKKLTTVNLKGDFTYTKPEPSGQAGSGFKIGATVETLKNQLKYTKELNIEETKYGKELENINQLLEKQGKKNTTDNRKELEAELTQLAAREAALKRINELETKNVTNANGEKVKLYESSVEALNEYRELLDLVIKLEANMSRENASALKGKNTILPDFNLKEVTDVTGKLEAMEQASYSLYQNFEQLQNKLTDMGGADFAIYDQSYVEKLTTLLGTIINQLDKAAKGNQELADAEQNVADAAGTASEKLAEQAEAERQAGEAGKEAGDAATQSMENAGDAAIEAAKQAEEAAKKYDEVRNKLAVERSSKNVNQGLLNTTAQLTSKDKIGKATEASISAPLDSMVKEAQVLTNTLSQLGSNAGLSKLDDTLGVINRDINMITSNLEKINGSKLDDPKIETAKAKYEETIGILSSLKTSLEEVRKDWEAAGASAEAAGEKSETASKRMPNKKFKAGGTKESTSIAVTGEGTGEHAGPLYTEEDVKKSRDNVDSSKKYIQDAITEIKESLKLEVTIDENGVVKEFLENLSTKLTEAQKMVQEIVNGETKIAESKPVNTSTTSKAQQTSNQTPDANAESYTGIQNTLVTIKETIEEINGLTLSPDISGTSDRLDNINSVLQSIKDVIPEINGAPLILLNADEADAIEKIKAAISTISQTAQGSSLEDIVNLGSGLNTTISKQVSLYKEILDINNKIAKLDELSIGYNNELATLEDNRSKAQRELLDWYQKERDILKNMTSGKSDDEADALKRIANEKRLQEFQEARAKKERTIAETNAKVQTNLLKTVAKESEKEAAAEEKRQKAAQAAAEKQTKEEEKRLQYEQKVQREVEKYQQKLQASTKQAKADEESTRLKAQNDALDKQVEIYGKILDAKVQIAKLDKNDPAYNVKKDYLESNAQVENAKLAKEMLEAKRQEQAAINQINDSSQRAMAQQEAQQKRMLALEDMRVKKEREIADAQVSNQAKILKTVDSYANSKSYQNIGNLITKEQATSLENKKYLESDIENLSAAYEKLKTAIDNVNKAQNPSDTEKYYAEFKTAKKNVEELSGSMQKLVKSSAGNTTKSVLNIIGKASDLADAKQQLASMNDALRGITPTTSDAGKGITTLTYTLKAQDGIVKTLKYQFNEATGAIAEFGGQEKKIASVGERFSAMLKERGMSLVAYLSTFASFYRLVGVLKDGINTVNEVDTAFTELRKVADESDATLKSFANTVAFDVAGSVGSSGKDIINLAADFERLGYSIQEAQELAKNTAVYMNVGDMESSDEAMQHLVSTMKGFGLEAEDSMKIIDEFNEVGRLLPLTNYIG